jgi:hypothetical protein
MFRVVPEHRAARPAQGRGREIGEAKLRQAAGGVADAA